MKLNMRNYEPLTGHAFTEFRTTEGMKVIEDHYLLKMESDSVIKPAFIEAVGNRMTRTTGPIESDMHTRVKN